MLFSSVEVVRFARFVRFVGRYSASVIFITSIRLRIGRGKKCANIAGQSNSANTLSPLISDWESSAFEVSDDDIDDGISLVDITSGLEKYRFSAGKTIDAKAFTRQRDNIIRGPPSFT